MSDTGVGGAGLAGSAGSPDAATITELLESSELVVIGRLTTASNQTWLCSLGDDEPRAVYKPIAGERPLWDFPDGTLAARERAAYLVSELLGWGIVPVTILRDGPAGPGMVQWWCEPDPEQDAVDVVPAGPTPSGWRHVLDAQDAADRRVMLIHEDSASLRRMALFDIVVNNTDRKGGHVLAMADGRRLGIDHGVCFHVEDKLRTVLWGFAGEPLTEDEISGLVNLGGRLLGPDAGGLADLVTAQEIRRTIQRVDRLLEEGAFPLPEPGWPALPWPPF